MILNAGVTKITYTKHKYLTIFNHHSYFELFDGGDQSSAERHCKSACDVDPKCKAVVLTHNDHRRVPQESSSGGHGPMLNYWLCDIFHKSLTTHLHEMQFDRFEQSHSRYFEKMMGPEDPRYLIYETQSCRT